MLLFTSAEGVEGIESSRGFRRAVEIAELRSSSGRPESSGTEDHEVRDAHLRDARGLRGPAAGPGEPLRGRLARLLSGPAGGSRLRRRRATEGGRDRYDG